MVAVRDLISGDLAQIVFIGFASGFLLGAFIAAIRGVVKIACSSLSGKS